ncbi:methyltransferase-like protein 27 isoform X1 [Hyla sarda]|uniref:methyltransferase-like protein 27 isoform X1 n=1 Tax=Hyla sarda TaxID=327740 RepID=UPI0024C350FC|nr:methyltransferase-like protein 27 isoform X1 [Hyla sarda]XP_056414516.1 methyltransferase-like protein 27 isoform X1 [Hyla sarda]XP_056414517.1 methyltransferase-like protein 27 isoform X1 [Hyla sarda]
MANCEKGLQQVRDVIAAAHEDCSLLEKLQFYDRWSTQYEEDVSILDYKAPHLAALALASVCQLNRESKLVLDVACGTGRAAEELQRCGFNLFHGLDGSAGMLEVAKKKGLYQQLKQNMLGQTQFPYDSEKYDAVMIVGALSDGQVPVSVIPELLRVTKPGGFVCMTTRCNISNLRYKAKLEEEMSSLQNKGLWEQVLIQEVEQWEKATSEKEITHKSDYIPGVIYIYRKMLTPSIVS